MSVSSEKTQLIGKLETAFNFLCSYEHRFNVEIAPLLREIEEKQVRLEDARYNYIPRIPSFSRWRRQMRINWRRELAYVGALFIGEPIISRMFGNFIGNVFVLVIIVLMARSFFGEIRLGGRLKREIPQWQANADARYEALRSDLLKNKHLVEWLPEHYWSSEAVKHMLHYLKYGRADTYKEMLNLYDQQMHMWRMEQNQQQMLNNIQHQSQMMRTTMTMASIAAFASVWNTR